VPVALVHSRGDRRGGVFTVRTWDISVAAERRWPFVLEEIARRHGRTARQVALNFLTRHSSVFAIPKTTHPERVRENAAPAAWELTPEDLAAIDREPSRRRIATRRSGCCDGTR
jgi:diketogulonate reductase-like aldo/keto reductase